MKLTHLIAAAVTMLVLRSAVHASATDLPVADQPTINAALTLQQAIALASADNLSLKQSLADADAASAEARVAVAGTKPGISTTTYGTVGDSSNIAASAPGVMPENYLTVPTHGFADQNILLMAPLYTGGRLAGQARQTRAQSKAASFTVSETRLTVDEAVTDAYAKALLQTALVDVAQARLTAEDEQVRVMTQNVQVGRSAPVDLLRDQAEQASAREGLIAARNDSAQALVDLKAAMGVSQQSQVVLTDTLDTAAPDGRLPASLDDALRLADANRPDLLAAASQVEAAQAAVRSADGAYSPQVYALGMTDASASDGGGRLGYTIGLAASLPLYDAGARKAEVDAAKARLARAVADAQMARQTVDQEVASAWLSLQTASEQIDAAKSGLAAAQQSYDLATLRYNAGKSIDVQRLDALSALIRARGDQAGASANLIEARARLTTAIAAMI